MAEESQKTLGHGLPWQYHATNQESLQHPEKSQVSLRGHERKKQRAKQAAVATREEGTTSDGVGKAAVAPKISPSTGWDGKVLEVHNGATSHRGNIPAAEEEGDDRNTSAVMNGSEPSTDGASRPPTIPPKESEARGSGDAMTRYRVRYPVRGHLVRYLT